MNKLTYEELEKRIIEAKKLVPLGSKWRHYKGGEYTISAIAVLEESQEVAVIYTPLAHPEVSFVRPLSVWDEQVEWEGSVITRFSQLT